jgi:hypothetical protein
MARGGLVESCLSDAKKNNNDNEVDDSHAFLFLANTIDLALATNVKWTAGDTNGHAAATAPRSQKYWNDHNIERPDYAKKFVSVNTIIGMPMIKPAKLSLDLIDNVVESGVLDTEPFPVIYRPTIQSKPDFSKIGSDNTKLLTTNLEYGHITSSDATACRVALEDWDYSIVDNEPTAKRVKFDEASIDDLNDTAAVYPPSTS